MRGRAALVGVVFLLCANPAPARAQASDPQPDHSGHQQQPTPPPADRDGHKAHEGDVRPEAAAAVDQPVTPIPPLTDADRRAAFPQLEGHTAHDRATHYSVLFDQLEWQTGAQGGLTWDTTNWWGGDVHRLWVRSEGEMNGSTVESADAHLLYGRAIARWWDLVAGVRQDMRPGPSRTWAAVGIQGLAPYWFDIQATASVGAEGRTHARVETEYELLFTNRLVLQPLVELELYGKDDPERGIGAGLSTLEAGVRLRYEFRRELAPYVGVTWRNAFGRTADLAEQRGERAGRVRAVIGIRTWF